MNKDFNFNESEDSIIDLPLSLDDFIDITENLVDSVPTALFKCLNDIGRVDIEYISKLCGKEKDEVIEKLHGAIYQNPAKWDENPYEGFETSDEYLSGNLMQKLREVIAANNQYSDRFRDNYNAIKKALPPAIDPNDIYITIGSPWVPVDVISEFISYIFGNARLQYYINSKNSNIKIIHDDVTGVWEITGKASIDAFSTTVSKIRFGTSRMPFSHILENTLNLSRIAVYDTVDTTSNKSGKAKVVNDKETLLANEKQQLVIEKFREWVWTDNARKKKLLDIYESKYSKIVKRVFDGSFLEFPEINKNIPLFDFQKDAIARIIMTPATLLAHDVGSGKTYIMIAAGMEMKRMGISKKNLYVVPNNIVLQWKAAFKELYPNSNVYCIEAKDFIPAKRTQVLENMRDNEYDAIIMPYSSFDMLSMSLDFYLDKIDKEMNLINMSQLSPQAKKNEKNKLEKLSKELAAEYLKNDIKIYFDELGINTLFVDEAHNYKNLACKGYSDNGLAPSKKCEKMLDKIRYVQDFNNGRGVVFATGTPLTNSITDAFVMQTYLQPGTLELLGINNFDNWAGMFAEKRTEFEIDVDTSKYKLVTRFTRFHNLPELTSIFAMIADFHQVNVEDVPECDGYQDITIEESGPFRAYLKKISARADKIRSRQIDKKEDNLLKVTIDGRKAALDLRLVDDKAPIYYQDKVFKCAANVHKIYLETRDFKGTQLVFCDSSTPKEGFNMYDELKRILMMYGIREDEIAFIHDATTDTKKEALLASVRAGKVRVLIGSTFKLGLGINVQERLFAIHHLDVPWRPADMVQREGRLIRQGNTNEKVEIYRYVTKNSFDAYSWQILESKQRFITQLLNGSIIERDGSDIDQTVLSYAEIKALAVGNPKIKERVEVANQLQRYIVLNREAFEQKRQLEQKLKELPARIEKLIELIQHCKEDNIRYNDNKREYTLEERNELRHIIYQKLVANVINEKDEFIADYQGFSLIAPKFSSIGNMQLIVRGNGKYQIPINTEQGTLRTIDYFLEHFVEKAEDFEKKKLECHEEDKAVRVAIDKITGYQTEIDDLTEKLEEIDKLLGVAKK